MNNLRAYLNGPARRKGDLFPVLRYKGITYQPCLLRHMSFVACWERVLLLGGFFLPGGGAGINI